MIKQLHPTLKKCACGFIGTRSELYKHFDKLKGFPNFFKLHGEVPLNIDDNDTPSLSFTQSQIENS